MQITANLLGFALVAFHMINVSLGVPIGISNDEGKEIMNHHDANTTKLNKKVNLCLVLLYSLGGGLIKDSAYETARPIPLERMEEADFYQISRYGNTKQAKKF